MIHDLHTAAARAAECVKALQGALHAAGPMAALVILPMIKSAAELEAQIRAALNAAVDEAAADEAGSRRP